MQARRQRAGAGRGGTRSRSRARRRDEELARVHDRGAHRDDRATAGRAAMLDPDTFTSPESVRGRAAGRRGGASPASTTCSSGRRPAPRSPWCGRPGTTPSAIARWASACSTTSRSPPPARRARGARARRDRRLSTSTTATARSGSSTTTRRCSTSRRTSSRSTRAPARRPRSARGDGHGLHGERAARGRAPATPTTTDVFARWSCRCSTQFAPDLMLVSAGFDAHERRSAGADADDDRRAIARR